MANLIYPLYQLMTLFTAFLNPIGFDGEPKPRVKFGTHKALFVFGDSLFDPGNNQYLNGSLPQPAATTWPYGETYFEHPTGRLSDGRIVPDFIAEFAKLPILTPYLQPGSHRFTDGTNFASAGAGVLPETNSGTIHINLQLSYFKDVEKSLRKEISNEAAKNLLKRAVYLFSIGGNDYFSFYTMYPNATQTDQRKYVEMVIGNLTSVLKEIYGMGGRKFAFQNAGPLGCLPSIEEMNPNLGGDCAEELSKLARLHNRYLASVLKKLESELPGFKYSLFDYFNSLGDRVSSPSTYGFKEGKAACCGSGTYRGSGCGGGVNGTDLFEVCSDPGEYVWFDGAHTTERTNRQLAELLWSGVPNVTGPYNIKKLFELAQHA